MGGCSHLASKLTYQPTELSFLVLEAPGLAFKTVLLQLTVGQALHSPCSQAVSESSPPPTPIPASAHLTPHDGWVPEASVEIGREGGYGPPA